MQAVHRQPHARSFTVGGVPGGNFAATSSFAEMTIIKEVQAVPIDKEVPLTSACLIACGVVTGMGSVFNRANVQPGDKTRRLRGGRGRPVGHPGAAHQGGRA